MLGPLAALHPQWALAHYELALALSGLDRSAAAIAALQRAVTLKPDMADAWRALGDELTTVGDAAGADSAYAQNIRASTKDERLLTAAAALCENNIPQAEALLRAHLKKYPDRRRRVTHAGGSCGAAWPLRGRGDSAVTRVSNLRRALRPRGTTARLFCTGKTSRPQRCAR